MTPEVATWLIAQGPSGVIIACLLYAVVYLFKRLDETRTELTTTGIETAKTLALATKAIEQVLRFVDRDGRPQ